MRPRVVVLSAPGTNRHHDMAFAFSQAGAETVHVSVMDLPERMAELRESQILAIAGGFSYADALGSGRVFAMEIKSRIGDVITEKVARGMPVIGICNGFQVLTRAGILPGATHDRALLAHNDGGSFECRWVSLTTPPSRCVWTRGIDSVISCPVAHGEGRFNADESTMSRIIEGGQVAVRYARPDGSPAGGEYPDNPNGSVGDIAGICDPSGLVLGLMPHPENHVVARQGRSGSRNGTAGMALGIFRNGVEHAANS